MAEKENNLVLYVLVAGVAVLLVGGIASMKFMNPPPPPPPPPPAPTPERSMTTSLRYKPDFYAASVGEHAKRLGIAAPTIEALGAPLARSVEIDQPRKVKVGETLTTPHLKIAVSVVKAWAKGGSGQGFRYEHLVTTITNTSAEPRAYLVETEFDTPDRCRSQGAVTHNALALAPGEKAERAECLWRKGMTLQVKRAETIALPEIGYYWVSRLVPSQIGLEERTALGHAVPKDLSPCKFVPWRDIEGGGATWADVIDFYARHDCDEYSFYKGYTFRTEPIALPARKPGSQPAPAAPPPAPTGNPAP